MPINKSWDENKLYVEVRKAFPVLGEAKSKFVKACYGEIVVSKNTDGVSMDALRNLSIDGEGCIYLVPERAVAIHTDFVNMIPSDTDDYENNPDSILKNNPFDITETPLFDNQSRNERQLIL